MKLCLKCRATIKKKGSRYCSRKCWLSSEEYAKMRFERKEEIYKKSSLSLTGRVIPEHTKRAVSEARKKIVGPLHHNWNPDRIEQGRKHKLARMVHGLVGRALAQTGADKTDHGVILLGYGPLELRAHLEKLFQPGMSWENHGKGPGKWHVDHIRPVSDFTPESLVSEINALKNLRPLWEHENLSLGGKQACKIRWRRLK